MAEMIGATAASLGFATLGLLVAIVGLRLTFGVLAPVQKETDRLIPISLTVMSDDESDAAFKRTRSADEVGEWVEMLRSQSIVVGKSFKFATETLDVETPTEDGKGTVTTPVEFLVDSTSDDDPDGVTVRTAKRRFNAAAKILGFNLSWKQPKGWLIAKATSTVAATTEAAVEAPQTPASTPEASEAPVSGPTVTVASAPAQAANGGRRVVRRQT
jgi:hypothetical protein